jgi:hypothetical protein
MSESANTVVEAFYRALSKPGRLRRKLILWLWPELRRATRAMQDYYWQPADENRHDACWGR